jgi:hypothetical protein
MTQEADEALDHLLHAEEVGEVWIAAQGAVLEDPAQSLVGGRIDELGLADGVEHALGRAGVHQGIRATAVEVLVERHLDDGSAIAVLLLGEFQHATVRHGGSVGGFTESNFRSVQFPSGDLHLSTSNSIEPSRITALVVNDVGDAATRADHDDAERYCAP